MQNVPRRARARAGAGAAALGRHRDVSAFFFRLGKRNARTAKQGERPPNARAASNVDGEG